MEITGINYPNQKFTLRWLGFRTLFFFIAAFVLALFAGGIDHIGFLRQNSGLLDKDTYEIFSGSVSYCFALIFITCVTLCLVEIAFRKELNYLQYALISCSLCVSYLLLLSMSEFIPFSISFAVASMMTIALISIYIKGITRQLKPVFLILSVLCVEYVLIYILSCINSMALLVGSLSLFILIAVAMYFTLKLKVENNELTFK